MEIFVEEMVAKKKNGACNARILGLAVLCFAVVFILMTVVITAFAAFAPFIFLASAGCVYGTYILISGENVEFEYALVNNEIDIDKIVNRKKRKKLTSANLRELESFGTRKNPDYEKYVRDPAVKKVYACRDKNADDVFFLLYIENTVKKMLVFSPSEKITSVVEKYNPKRAII